jgi:hypothetical protein
MTNIEKAKEYIKHLKELEDKKEKITWSHLDDLEKLLTKDERFYPNECERSDDKKCLATMGYLCEDYKNGICDCAEE